MKLLKAAELVAELSRLGLGTWTADAVRQWTRDDPPCPIAEPADNGKPHRFSLLDVLRWMGDRERRVKAKGFTSASRLQLIDRIDLVLRQFVTEGVAVAPPVPIVPAAPAADLFSAAQPKLNDELDTLPASISNSSDSELLMRVIEGTLPPETWHRVETAMAARTRRLERDGKLVPSEDLEQTLITQAVAVRSALQALIIPLSQRIPDHSTFDQRRVLIQSSFEDLLRRLAGDRYDADELDDDAEPVAA